MAEVVPTVAKLLREVEARRGHGYPARRYEVDADTQARIEANTHVWSEGAAIHVSTIGEVHLRPLYPIGPLPIRYNRAIAARANGAIRRLLKPDKG